MWQPDSPINASSAPEHGARLYRWQLLAWWLMSAAAVQLIPSLLKFRQPAWNLGTENEFQVLATGMAMLAAALAFESVGQADTRFRRLFVGSLFISIAFAAMAVLVHAAGLPISRLMLGISGVVAMLLMSLRIVLQRGHWIAIGVLALVLLAAGAVSMRLQSTQTVEITRSALTTEYYRLALDSYPVTYGTEVANLQGGGSLATVDDLQLLSTAQGALYAIRQSPEGTLRINATDIRVPVGVDEFKKFAPHSTYVLRVTGLAALRVRQDTTLYAAYDYWNRAKNCFSTRVSKVTISLTGEQAVKALGDWLQVFESKPCLEATTGYDAVQTGGRLAVRADGGLLLSLGDRGINGLNGVTLADRLDNDYGKVIQFTNDGGASTVFTIGHRNQQGLASGTSGRIWETEHGPQGGDEINLLVAGNDYGWPSVSYGTDYGHFVWPYSPAAHDHGTRSEPVLAFVPSIGISNLLELSSSRFPAWQGDLLVGSLKAKSLYRVRLRDARAIYAERIEIGHRIRDLASTAAGDLILWTDDGYIIRISPAAQASIYDLCSGCHEPSGQMPALGPPLRSIVDRKVADHFQFGYSAALRQLGGTWTEKRLNDFLRDPGSFAPGTTMTFRGIADDTERAKVIEFLKEYE